MVTLRSTTANRTSSTPNPTPVTINPIPLVQFSQMFELIRRMPTNEQELLHNFLSLVLSRQLRSSTIWQITANTSIDVLIISTAMSAFASMTVCVHTYLTTSVFASHPTPQSTLISNNTTITEQPMSSESKVHYILQDTIIIFAGIVFFGSAIVIFIVNVWEFFRGEEGIENHGQNNVNPPVQGAQIQDVQETLV
ncbi:hypothetical protein B9Z55_011561 [Caenorhabditis nigoni]|nr:hypothetical protein B9Z55_011561 [Caenorhabditis nigoni]